jgi:hypothetical protein
MRSSGRVAAITPDVIGLPIAMDENPPVNTRTRRTTMTDLKTIAGNYIAAWNEAAPGARDTLLSRAFTADIRYRDPIMNGEGHDGIAALIDGVQQQFPGFRFSLRSEPDGFGDAIRFSWSFGPAGGASVFEGTDIGVIENGRLKNVTGFLDKAPAQ